MGKSSLYVCEDHKIVVHGIVSILSAEDKFEDIKTFPTGELLMQALDLSIPDLIILDINLPDINGLELLKKIRIISSAVPVLILTMHNDPFLVRQTKNEGANGFLLKDFGEDQLLHAIETVLNGKFYTGPFVLQPDEKRDTFPGTFQLTNREKEIISYTAQGKSSQEIAKLLFLSPHTVNTHRRNIYKKLKLNNVKELVKFAYDNGMA
jgi:DNA-binding NarL/FixJ family response regulator